jgi:hypothetical protein
MTDKIAADLLVYGPCSNAGDVLIHQTFNALFRDEIDTHYRHIRADKLMCPTGRVVIGPGGLLSGAYRPDSSPDELVVRHLTDKTLSAWQKAKKKIVAFGTGTNTPFDAGKNAKPFSAQSEKNIAKLAALSSRLYLRGSRDILRLSSLCNSEDMDKFVFQPCPSIFLDRLFGIKPIVSDKVAVNFPLNTSITKENVAKHPLKRFKEFANAQGLTVVFMDNHPMDINPYVFELCDETTHDAEGLALISAEGFGALPEHNKKFEDVWMGTSSLPARFNGFRFAFGTRLHSFLPFMAFNTPTLFLSPNEIRRPMGQEYFQHAAFSAATPWANGSAAKVVDGMIDRMKYFMANEERLRFHIHEQRERLWTITLKNKRDMLDRLN